MRYIIQIIVYTFLIFTISLNMNAQTKKLSAEDQILQDSLYQSNRKKVLNFSMKEFDTLFFEFFTKKNNPDILLTKTEYYNYTVQIAAFSDRLARLYPDQKEVASQNKEQWLSESYEDYLEYKASQKK